MSKLVFLKENESTFVQGSAKKPYEIKRSGGVIFCSCPAWKNLGGSVDTRVCKHIKANIDPTCLLPQAKSTATKPKVKEVKLTKTGKISTAVGGVVTKDTAPPVLLAHRLEDEDPAGYWMSEKLDGVRAWWDGEKFISRLGNIYHAPEWFKDLMPQGVVLDGELWAGRGLFQKTVSIVRKLIPDDHEWSQILYVVFDLPTLEKPFEERIKEMQNLLCDKKGQKLNPVVLKRLSFTVLSHEKCKDSKHLTQFLKEVEDKKGEGVMLRESGSLYTEGRSKTLLKVKSYQDDEAVVLAHLPGRGKHKGRLGAVSALWQNKEFEIGSGFSDQQRKNPPKIGSKVTFSHQGLTDAGKPRFPIFLREYIEL